MNKIMEEVIVISTFCQEAGCDKDIEVNATLYMPANRVEYICSYCKVEQGQDYWLEGEQLVSKMKQHLEGQIVITGSNEETTGWKRYICFEYEGNQYELTLFWDEFDGYDTYWREPRDTPDWVVNWNDEAHNNMTFEHYLDDLTWEMGK